MNNSRIQANLMSTSHIKHCQISKRSQEQRVPESPHQSRKKNHLASSSVAVLAMPGDQTITSLKFISKFELLHAIIHESKSSGMLKLWQTEGQHQPTGTNYAAKRQSHHSPVSFQTPQCKRRIQYVISLSSLMVLPTLNAHATKPKILENVAKFHWISPFCMVRSRKKQCSVLIFMLHFAM